LCNNCALVAEYVDLVCRNQLTSVVGSATIDSTCTYATNLVGSACNGGCLGPASFCTDYTKSELVECQRKCGDYFGCRCYQVKGSLQYQCYGATVSGKSCRGLLEAENAEVAQNCNSESTCNAYFVCPTNRCLAFDVQCPAPSDCLEDPGICDADSGICSYFDKADNTPCNDGLFYTTNDKCITGKCVGVANRCLQYGIECSMPHNPCVGAGTCLSESGDCRFVKTPAGLPCDDGNPLTKDDQCNGKGVCKGQVFDPCQAVNCQMPPNEPCILSVGCVEGNCVFTKENELKSCGEAKVCAEGRCMETGVASETFFVSAGEGHCVDDDKAEINHYFNDVDEESGCVETCMNDPLCIGYSFMPYTGRTCFIYAPSRTRSALSFWTWRGTRSGTKITTTKSLGNIREFCYKRSLTPTSVEAGFSAGDYLISPMGTVLLLVLLSSLGLLYLKVYFQRVNSFLVQQFVKFKARFFKRSTD
jgi:hypothetical protein